MVANIILDTRRKTKNGYPIKIRIFNNKVKYIPLNLYSEIEHWNDNNVNSNHPNYRVVFQKINKRQLRLYDEVDYCNEHKLDLESSFQVIENGLKDNEAEIIMLKQRLKELQPKAKVGLLEFFDVRIKEKSKTNESTKAYVEVKKMLLEYLGSDINMNDVTYEFLNDFVVYKLQNGCGRGGVNAYLASIRPVYKEAQRRKSLNVKLDNPFIGLFKPSAKKEIVDISTEDFIKIINYKKTIKHSDKTWAITLRTIKLFKFQFDIGGHDLVDVALLKWSNYKKGRLKFKRYKNRNKEDGGKQVDVKVFNEDFIKKYGNKNSDRIFKFIPDPIKKPDAYKNFQSNINRSLSSISTNLKIDKISSKSTRYIFRSRAGELFIDDKVVMQIQGHQPPKGISSFSYQKKLPYNIIDEAHLKIINFLYT